MNIIEIITEFFLTGLFSLGGGFSSISFIKEIVEKYNLFLNDYTSLIIGISQSCPGPIGVNIVAFTGFKALNIVGLITAVLAYITPSIAIICILTKYLNIIKESKIIDEIFKILRPAVVALIIAAVLSIFESALFNSNQNFLNINYLNVSLYFIFLFFVLRYKKIHPVIFIVCGAVLGIILKL